MLSKHDSKDFTNVEAKVLMTSAKLQKKYECSSIRLIIAFVIVVVVVAVVVVIVVVVATGFLLPFWNILNTRRNKDIIKNLK